MTTIAAFEAQVPDSVPGVLAAARESRRAADAHEVRVFVLATAWAEMHAVDAESDCAAAYFYGSEAITAAADGVPGCAAWAAADFAATLGLTSEAGTSLLADAVETRHRLPRVWARVLAGEVAVWRARRIAQQTSSLPATGAEFVDQQVAFCAHIVGVSQLDRLVQEARVRFDPETAESEFIRSSEDRFFTIEHEQISFTGSSQVHGCLDLADALELERAVSTGAEELKALGSSEPIEIRRAQAVGVLARGQLALGFGQGPVLAGVLPGEVAGMVAESAADESPQFGGSVEGSPSAAPGGWEARRQVELVVHTSAEAVAAGLPAGTIGRCGVTETPVLMSQVREWLRLPGIRVAVRPVIDITDGTPVGRYEIPDRMSRAVEERDVTCVFPWCHRRAMRCDKDHVVPYSHDRPSTGGETSLINLAPLCRRHHRLKTAGLWAYRIDKPGHYSWSDRFGNHYLREPWGTTALDPWSIQNPREHTPTVPV